MLKENQIERSVLFYEDEDGKKVQFEYGIGTTLTEVAETFKNFLISTGFNYVTDVIINGPNQSWLSEPVYRQDHEETTSVDFQQENPEEDEIPF